MDRLDMEMPGPLDVVVPVLVIAMILVVVTVDVVRRGRSVAERLVWLAAVLLVPVVGVLGWLLVGRWRRRTTGPALTAG